MARWRRPAFLALFLLLCAVCALQINAPLDRDEGAFLTIAQLILHGRLPYRDVFDQKPPGIYYLLAALLTLTRPLSLHAQIQVMRLAAVAANALSALGLLRLGARWGRPQAGRLAALFWLAACAAPLFGANQLFTEPFATTATIWAVERLANRASVRAGIEAGLLLALATLFKQTAILALPSLALLLWARPRLAPSAQSPTSIQSLEMGPPSPASGGGQGERSVRTLTALLASASLPWVALVAAYTLLGAADALWYQVVIVNLTGYPATPIATLPLFLAATLGLLYCGPLLLALLRLSSLFTYTRQRWRRADRGALPRRRLLIATALALLLMLQMLPMVAHPYPHYLIQALPWLALLLALAVAHEESSGAPRGPLAWSRRALTAALMTLPLLIGAATALSAAPVESAALSAQVARGQWIAAYTAPDARLLIAPAEPEYYFLSGRLPTTPYVYLLPVNHATYPVAQVTAQIRARRFDVVVWFPDTVQSDAQQQYSALYLALKQNYHPAPGSDQTAMLFQR